MRERRFDAVEISTGKGIIVGVIDNGFYDDDPDLKGAYLPDQFILDGVNHHPGTSCSAHGSLVSSIIAAHESNEGGFVGVAPDAKILRASIGSDELTHLACKKEFGEISESEEKLFEILNGDVQKYNQQHQKWMDAVVRKFPNIVTWLVDHGAQIINISFTLSAMDSSEWAPVKSAIELAQRRGVMVVAAAGNFIGAWDESQKDWINPFAPEFGYKHVLFPAAYPGVFSAGGYFQTQDDQSAEDFPNGAALGIPAPYDKVPWRRSTMHGEHLDFVFSTNGNPLVLRAKMSDFRDLCQAISWSCATPKSLSSG